jgi:hypothetical protein
MNEMNSHPDPFFLLMNFVGLIFAFYGIFQAQANIVDVAWEAYGILWNDIKNRFR